MTGPSPRQAIILAGGAGTRLASRLNGQPKPMVDVDGTPLLERQLRQLAAAGFREAIILVNHRSEVIEAFCDKLEIPGLAIHVRDDGAEARGTAGATYEARDLLADRFLVVYGDTLFDIDLNSFWAAHEAASDRGVEATLFLHPNDHPHDSDLVEIDETSLVRAFHPKPHPAGALYRNLVNAALYVVDKKLIVDLPAGSGIVDFGRDFFPRALDCGRRLAGYVTFEYIKDLGTPERLDRVVRDLRSGKVARARLSEPQRAVFLDRDGTLNALAGHIASPDQLELLDGAAEAVRAFNRGEYRCVLITNQPVVARGECTAEGLERIHAKLETRLGERGAFLDAIYYCPHHPDSGFPGEVSRLKIACDCRKPAPGLLLRAVSDLSIDKAASWMIGDSAADVGAARRAQIRSVLLRGSGVRGSNLAEPPDYEVHDIGEAAALILGGADSIRDALSGLVNRIRPGMMVRIAGQSRAGKSFAASVLRDMLRDAGIDAISVSLDRWTKALADRPPGGDVTTRYDIAGANAALADWTRGGALDVVTPNYDPLKRHRDPNGWRMQASADAVVIVEGILSFDLDAGARSALSLFVSVPEEARRKRFLREYVARGESQESAQALYESRLRDEFGIIERLSERADAVVSLPSFPSWAL